MSRFHGIVRLVVAALAGYLLIAVLVTLGLEVWLGGVSFHESTRGTLLLAGGCVFLSALAGGYLAAWIGRDKPLRHMAMVFVPVALDSAWVIASDFGDPLWFELLAAMNLWCGVGIGGWLRARLQGPNRQYIGAAT